MLCYYYGEHSCLKAGSQYDDRLSFRSFCIIPFCLLTFKLFTNYCLLVPHFADLACEITHVDVGIESKSIICSISYGACHKLTVANTSYCEPGLTFNYHVNLIITSSFY